MTTAVPTRLKRSSRRIGARSSGTDEAFTLRSRPVTSTQRTVASPAGGSSAARSASPDVASRRATTRISFSSGAMLSSSRLEPPSRRSRTSCRPSPSSAISPSRSSSARRSPERQMGWLEKSSVRRMQLSPASTRRVSSRSKRSVPFSRAACTAGASRASTRSRLATLSRSRLDERRPTSAVSSPFPRRSRRLNSRCSERRVTLAPRCPAAASSRWCPSSTTSRSYGGRTAASSQFCCARRTATSESRR